MSVTAAFKVLLSKANWSIHWIGLVSLAAAISVNIALEYGNVEKSQVRQLVSETSIAAGIAKNELGSIVSLLDDMESFFSTAGGNADTAPLLRSIVQTRPYITSVSIHGRGRLIASIGPENITKAEETESGPAAHGEPAGADSPPSLIFRRSDTSLPENGRTIRLTIAPDFWERRLASVFSSTDASMAVFDSKGRTLLPFSNLNESDQQKLAEALSQILKDNLPIGIKSLNVAKASSWLVVQSVAAPFLENGPLVIGMVWTGSESFAQWRRDALLQALALLAIAFVSTAVLAAEMRSRRSYELNTMRMHRDIHEREKFISILMEHAPIMVSYWNSDCRCQYANRMYREWFGKSEAQMKDIGVKELLGEELFARCEPLIAATLHGEPQTFEQMRTRADGAAGYVLSRYIPDREGTMVCGFFAISTDVTDLKNAQLTLEKRIEDLYLMATTDVLTGINNRRNLLEKIQLEIERERRYGQHIAFLMLDIDHFKRINDKYGHAAGDAVLRYLGALLADTMRTSDHVGRLGGEEFGILLVNVSLDQSFAIAERLRKKVESSRVAYGEEEIRFTVSIGLADCLADRESPLDDMLKRADVALYRAKNSGRNRVSLAENLVAAQYGFSATTGS